MSSDEKKDSAEDFETPRWAADEPTAVWDDSILEEAGYEKLAEHRKEVPRSETGPATDREVKGDRKQGVYVSQELTGGHPAQPGPAPKGGSGISWVLTVGIAIALGVAVYFLVSFLR